MFGPLPRHPQPAQGKPNGCVADQPWGETLGETDFGSQSEGPQTGGLAERTRTFVQQRPEGLTDASVEDDRYRVRPRRLRLQHSEAALVESMNDVAHGLVGTAKVTRNQRGRLALRTGEKDLTATDSKRERGPNTSLEPSPLVRRE
jgi:hypothetical protein